MTSFINISNHHSSKWNNKQLEAARNLGEIRDIQFPNIPPTMSSEEVREMAVRDAETLTATGDNIFHVMGELSYCFYLISELKRRGCRCVVSCTARNVVELKDGTKQVRFEFEQFREI